MQRKVKGIGIVFALALAGCAGNSTLGGGIFNQPAPRLRIVNGLPQVSHLDAVISGQALPDPVTTNLAYGTVSGTSQSPYDILNQRGAQVVSVSDDANPTVTVTSFNRTFFYGDKITGVIYGPTASPHNIQLIDGTTNAGSNTADVRIVDAAAGLGAVDLFIVPAGQSNTTPTQLNPGDAFPTQGSNSDSNYKLLQNVDKQFQVSVYPQGNDTGTPLLQQNVQINSSDRLTLIVLDAPQGTSTPQLLVIHDNNSNAG